MEKAHRVTLDFSPQAYKNLAEIRRKLKELKSANDPFGLVGYATSLIGEEREINNALAIKTALRLLSWYLTSIVETDSQLLVRTGDIVKEIELNL